MTKRRGAPLWMPEGSVHALAMFAVLGCSIYLVINQIPVPQWWQFLTGGAISGYSVYRHLSPTKPDTQAPRKPVNLDEVDLLSMEREQK